MITAIKERPVLFAGDMVRAIESGTKTQTRRIMKPLADTQGRTFLYRNGKVWASLTEDELAPLDGDEPQSVFGAEALFDGEHCYSPVVVGKGPKGEGNPLRCPYGQPGDRLWVREAWQVFSKEPHRDWPGVPVDRPQIVSEWNPLHCVCWRADGPLNQGELWRPSIHMPRWASRLLLEITDIRIEQLKEISEADAQAEGANPYLLNPLVPADTYTEAFQDLWESINGPESWDANPWVWAVSFKRIEHPER